MKLKLDENLGQTAAVPLAAAGHDVATVFTQRLAGATDRELLEACRVEGRCLVTMDLEFADPWRYVPEEHAGIAVIRSSGRHTPSEISAAASTLARALAGTNATGKLWVVEGRRIRLYDHEQRP